MDDAICKTRVITQDWAGAQTSVKKLAASFFHLVNSVQVDKAATDKAYEKLMTELAQHELVMSQLSVVERRCEDEVSHYKQVHADIDKSIETTAAELEQLKKQLEAERVFRKRRQEYETFAKQVNRVKSRAELQAALDALDADIAAVEAESATIDVKLEKRKAQFQLIMCAVDDLERTLDEEKEEESRVASAAAASAAFSRLSKEGAEAGAGSGGAAVAADGSLAEGFGGGDEAELFGHAPRHRGGLEGEGEAQAEAGGSREGPGRLAEGDAEGEGEAPGAAEDGEAAAAATDDGGPASNSAPPPEDSPAAAGDVPGADAAAMALDA